MNIYEHLNVYDAIATIVSRIEKFDIKELILAFQRQHINTDTIETDMYDHVKVHIPELNLSYYGHKRNNSQELRPDFASGDNGKEIADISAKTYWVYGNYYDREVKIECSIANIYEYNVFCPCGGVDNCELVDCVGYDMYYDSDLMKKKYGNVELPANVENAIANVTNMFALSKYHSDDIILNCESEALFDFVRCEMRANEYVQSIGYNDITQNKTNKNFSDIDNDNNEDNDNQEKDNKEEIIKLKID